MTTDDNAKAFLQSLHDNPFNPVTRAVFADYLEQNSDMERAEQLRKGLIPLTEYDLMAVSYLANCNFAPATWDKRFARDLAARAESRPPAFTPKQYLWLWVLLRRYRKSVGSARVREDAERRYDRYVDMLDLGWIKPAMRKRKPRMNDQTTLFDEPPMRG